jgi:hypothetical protein
MGISLACSGKDSLSMDAVSSSVSRLDSLLARVRSLEERLGKRRRARASQTVNKRVNASPIAFDRERLLLLARFCSAKKDQSLV